MTPFGSLLAMTLFSYRLYLCNQKATKLEDEDVSFSMSESESRGIQKSYQQIFRARAEVRQIDGYSATNVVIVCKARIKVKHGNIDIAGRVHQYQYCRV